MTYDRVFLEMIATECETSLGTVRVWLHRGKLGHRRGHIDMETLLIFVKARRVALGLPCEAAIGV